MSLSKQILVLVCIISALVLLHLYDGFIAKRTGKSTQPLELISLQDWWYRGFSYIHSALYRKSLDCLRSLPTPWLSIIVQKNLILGVCQISLRHAFLYWCDMMFFWVKIIKILNTFPCNVVSQNSIFLKRCSLAPRFSIHLQAFFFLRIR